MENKEIKFKRAHFDYDGKFLGFSEWGIGVNNSDMCLPASRSDENRSLAVDLQYTGLKDRNEKEIYEGDIMYWKYDDKNEPNGYGEDWVEITFSGGSFGWIGSITNKFHSFFEDPIEEYIVCGNIYENPELLK